MQTNLPRSNQCKMPSIQLSTMMYVFWYVCDACMSNERRLFCLCCMTTVNRVCLEVKLIFSAFFTCSQTFFGSFLSGSNMWNWHFVVHRTWWHLCMWIFYICWKDCAIFTYLKCLVRPWRGIYPHVFVNYMKWGIRSVDTGLKSKWCRNLSYAVTS